MLTCPENRWTQRRHPQHVTVASNEGAANRAHTCSCGVVVARQGSYLTEGTNPRATSENSPAIFRKKRKHQRMGAASSAHRKASKQAHLEPNLVALPSQATLIGCSHRRTPELKDEGLAHFFGCSNKAHQLKVNPEPFTHVALPQLGHPMAAHVAKAFATPFVGAASRRTPAVRVQPTGPTPSSARTRLGCSHKRRPEN